MKEVNVSGCLMRLREGAVWYESFRRCRSEKRR